jgi:uracil-DNA glycosylase
MMNPSATQVKIEPRLSESWKTQLEEEFRSPYFIRLKEFLLREKSAGKVIYPPGRSIFRAFENTPFEEVKVVILGQDPYHGQGQANGLCFSVSEGIPLPPSLKNIFKELQSDLGIPFPKNGNLDKWASQGVLLLNATLTVRAGEAGSHQNQGWEQFTDTIIRLLSEKKEGLVFLLWGRFAQAKEGLIDSNKHYLLKAAHPSPFSAHSGFLGCRHFSKANQLLISSGKEPVDWRLD